ncbi:hypothetical protein AN401_11705 [Zobellella denitrificans]|uniref:DUF2190 family protein n=1 Tax=Zobellella denitrificans TaxID=347534 RepID=A0A291HQD0_9GAMM|nr:hypothetical protein [Zobellella denitrificans]ATG74436.1 hypothetical protein AN401_11705 [Zobellella denitrificans]
MIAKRTGNKRAYPVKAGIALLSGEPVVLAAGYLTNVLGTASCVGMVTLPADNGAGLDGELTAEVEVGEFKFANAGDITVANVGATVYFADANTVSVSDDTGTRATAGKLVQVDADGVWVELGV